jgi:hypothetical protein
VIQVRRTQPLYAGMYPPPHMTHDMHVSSSSYDTCQPLYAGGRTWKRGHNQAHWPATVPSLGSWVVKRTNLRFEYQ